MIFLKYLDQQVFYLFFLLSGGFYFGTIIYLFVDNKNRPLQFSLIVKVMKKLAEEDNLGLGMGHDPGKAPPSYINKTIKNLRPKTNDPIEKEILVYWKQKFEDPKNKLEPSENKKKYRNLLLHTNTLIKAYKLEYLSKRLIDEEFDIKNFKEKVFGTDPKNKFKTLKQYEKECDFDYFSKDDKNKNQVIKENVDDPYLMKKEDYINQSSESEY